MRIWIFKNLSVEKIIEEHCERITQPVVNLLNWEEALTCTGTPAEPIYEIVREGKPMPRKTILYHKFLFLNHIIISRATGCKEKHFPLNSEVLRRVIGDAIYDMLDTLEDMQLILITRDYIPGVTARKIKLCNWDITHIDLDDRKITKYVSETKDLLEEATRLRLEKRTIYSQEFIDSYNNSLSFLALSDERGMLDYIYHREYESIHQQHFYESCHIRFKESNHQIVSVDKNGRIYHYMTNLPSSLKQFFNVRYYIDIANSHPLLYSSFLISHYTIRKEELENIFSIPYKEEYKLLNLIIVLYSLIQIIKILYICSIFKKDKSINFKIKREIIRDRKYFLKYYIHYVSEQLIKHLKDRGLKRIKGLNNDVLVYLHRVMKGKLWDEFQILFHTEERGKVKASLFREIFYSYSKRVSEKFKPYGALFRDMYPNVWHILRNEKGKEDLLPNQMMKLESKLFSTILEKCYAQGWKVFNIHDAVVVLNVPENDGCSPEKVRAIIEETYHARLLYPTVSIETYNQCTDEVEA